MSNSFPMRAVALCFVLSAVAPLRAQEEDDEIVDAPVAIQQNVVQFGADQVDQWIFGGGTNAAARRKQLEAHLELRVAEIEKVCGLSALQTKKLLLAGRGDIKRLMDRVDEVKRKFNAGQNDPNAMNQLFQQIAPFQNTPRSAVFDESSLFARTLQKVLDAEQAAKYEGVVQERRQFRHRARLTLLVSMYEQQMPFADEQRQRFLDLLLAEVPPSRKPGPNEYYGFMIQVAKIPEEKLKPIFDEAQWKILSPGLAEMKRMEPFFKDGMFINQGVAAEPAADEEAEEEPAAGPFAAPLTPPPEAPQAPDVEAAPAPDAPAAPAAEPDAPPADAPRTEKAPK